jgi:hypothetical protein
MRGGPFRRWTFARRYVNGIAGYGAIMSTEHRLDRSSLLGAGGVMLGPLLVAAVVAGATAP